MTLRMKVRMTLSMPSLRAKRSNPSSHIKKVGLLRRFAPRNDGLVVVVLIIKHRRRLEAAEFALDQLGKLDRGAVLQPRADDLHADWQAVRREAGRDRSRRQAR